MAKIFSVFELTALIRQTLEQEDLFQNVLVSGEMSNFRGPHASGHLYFTLKDEKASLRCVMWRSRAVSLRFSPQNGMKLMIRGSIGVYEKDGSYQMHVTAMEPDGLGSLYLAYEQLKARLQEEGLFDPERKRALPPFPRKVAVLTSPTGAAVRDVINVLGRRYPSAQVLVVPVPVQGDAAPGGIAAGLGLVSQMTDIDVVILGRGGGSIEELWAFNEEIVARAIAACPHPVISAVGHETDFTIADFVADVRAATPSAAAELAVPDTAALEAGLRQQSQRMARALTRLQQSLAQRLDLLEQRLAAASPMAGLREHGQSLKRLDEDLHQAMGRLLRDKQASLALAAASLNALSPLKVLARGYSVTRHRGRILTSSATVETGDEVVTYLRQGSITSVVTGKEKAE
jgi:exodeoxyribonuclease VII large subunit